jgi:pilus assembly protein CpaB
MNKRFLIALAGAVFFGLLSIMAAKTYLQNKVETRIAQEEAVLVVAATDIPIGTQISAAQIREERYPRRLFPQEAMLKKEEVVGRVTINEIPAKTPVLSRNLASPGSLAGLQGILKQGMRAVSVRVDESSSVSGFVIPGSYVDIIAIMQPQTDGAKPVSKVILQNVRVLSGGQKMQASNDGKPSLVNTVSLEVTPPQAEKLKLAETEGRLQLSIRNTTDQIFEPTPGATRRDVLNDIALERRALEGSRGGAAAAARPAPAIPPFYQPVVNTPVAASPAAAPAKPVKTGPAIELIEGSKRTRVEMIP